MKSEVDDLFDNMNKMSVLVVGDIMLDTYLFCELFGQSQEGPFPVILPKSLEHRSGGSGNVAKNCAAIANSVDLVCATSPGLHSDLLVKSISEMGNINLHIVPRSRTIEKTRIYTGANQLLRIQVQDEYAYSDRDIITKAVSSMATNHDVVLISDYSKGIMSPKLVDYLKDWRPGGVYADIKPEHLDWYEGVKAITPNSKEYSEMGLKSSSIEHVLVTRGANGAQLISGFGKSWEGVRPMRNIFSDPCGAGDVSFAYFSMAMQSGAEPLLAAKLATVASGISVREIGTTVVDPEEVREEFIKYLEEDNVV